MLRPESGGKRTFGDKPTEESDSSSIRPQSRRHLYQPCADTDLLRQYEPPLTNAPTLETIVRKILECHFEVNLTHIDDTSDSTISIELIVYQHSISNRNRTKSYTEQKKDFERNDLGTLKQRIIENIQKLRNEPRNIQFSITFE